MASLYYAGVPPLLQKLSKIWQYIGEQMVLTFNLEVYLSQICLFLGRMWHIDLHLILQVPM